MRGTNNYFIGILCLCIAFSTIVSAQESTQRQRPVSLLRDEGFARGFITLNPKQGARVTSGVLQPESASGGAEWEIAQWGSRFDMSQNQPAVGKGGEVVYADPGKTVIVYPDSSFVLEVKGREEFGDRPREFFESWPHLYLEQRFDQGTFLADYERLDFNLEGKHLYTINHLGTKIEKRLHTAQLIIQFFVHNKNPHSPGYQKESFILSLPVYDYRWDYRPETKFQDAGTKKTTTNLFVYGPGGEGLWDGCFRGDTVNWHSMNEDLLPHFWEGFIQAKRAGFMKHTQFSDLALSSFVFGWEMPGTFDAAMHFRNMQLMGLPKYREPKRPNIALIIADDLSWNDLGCFGNTDVKSPHLDALAYSGIRFLNAYVTASSCSPSRISLLTGRYPHNTGAAELHTPAREEEYAYFPGLLRGAGYFTALAGKWHEGKSTAQAYDTLFVNREQNGPGGEDQWNHLLDIRDTTKPFFFWMAAYDPHRDWSADQIEDSHRPEDLDIPPHLTDDTATRRDLASYYNEIARLDRKVAEFVQKLKEQGLYENTIIVFLSDNGRAFPGSKCRLNDQGVKTPLFVSWPGRVPNGHHVTSLISTIDLAPTLLDIAGVKDLRTIQGTSFSYLLSRPSASFRNYVFAEQNWHDYEGYQRMVRYADFLYIENGRPEKVLSGPLDVVTSPAYLSLRERFEKGTQPLSGLQADSFVKPPEFALYKLESDRYQQFNLIADEQYPHVLKHLREILQRWKQETGDTAPTTLTPDWYDLDGNRVPAHGRRGEMPGASSKAVSITEAGPF
ncbi:sulfatase family protein [Parapedobacter soli]|uniref:sulfatase family protein n=1 Tax=Parapedobacter soli TaxID=416955 RepID=UPI0021C81FB2|nr:sulfatase [Parapedobacter soli]